MYTHTRTYAHARVHTDVSPSIPIASLWNEVADKRLTKAHSSPILTTLLMAQCETTLTQTQTQLHESHYIIHTLYINYITEQSKSADFNYCVFSLWDHWNLSGSEMQALMASLTFHF